MSLPLATQGAVSAALGGAAPAYRVLRLAASNPAQRFRLRFGPTGVVVYTAAGGLSLALEAVGRDGVLSAVRPALPRAAGDRVSYARGALTEWYVNGPLGLEEGFDVARRPAGAGALTLAVRLGGSLRPRLERGGVALGETGLSYGGLEAVDAAGRSLLSTIAVRGDLVLLRIHDAGAIYPLRIDPMLEQQAKLTAASGTESGRGEFGVSVAVSADGNTTLIGGAGDDGFTGAAWVFTRSGSTWTQQAKLTAASGTETGTGDFGDAALTRRATKSTAP